jgi:hypothetical protein
MFLAAPPKSGPPCPIKCEILLNVRTGFAKGYEQTCGRSIKRYLESWECL